MLIFTFWFSTDIYYDLFYSSSKALYEKFCLVFMPDSPSSLLSCAVKLLTCDILTDLWYDDYSSFSVCSSIWDISNELSVVCDSPPPLLYILWIMLSSNLRPISSWFSSLTSMSGTPEIMVHLSFFWSKILLLALSSTLNLSSSFFIFASSNIWSF